MAEARPAGVQGGGAPHTAAVVVQRRGGTGARAAGGELVRVVPRDARPGGRHPPADGGFATSEDRSCVTCMTMERVSRHA